MKTPVRFALLLTGLAAAFSAHSHHSYAMFDGTKRLLVEGVVARLEWQNPHVFLWVYVPKEDRSGHTLLALESDSLNGLRRLGWTSTSITPGQTVKVAYFRLRDGRPGGHLISLTTAAGVTLSGGEGPIRAIEQTGRRSTAP